MNQRELGFNAMAFLVVQAVTAEKPIQESEPIDVSDEYAGGKVRASVLAGGNGGPTLAASLGLDGRPPASSP